MMYMDDDPPRPPAMVTRMAEQVTERTEGWGVIRPGERKAHYYRDTRSLCGRVGLYQGQLVRDGVWLAADCCTACRKRLSPD